MRPARAGTETRWTGTTGIAVDTTLRRLLFAARFKDLDLLISDQLTADSQLLFHRSLGDRLDLIAPFLSTTRTRTSSSMAAAGSSTSRTPTRSRTRSRMPQSFDPGRPAAGPGLGRDAINYIRNSVKITMDAYDGTMHFYVADPADPIIRAYQGIFPDAVRAARRDAGATCATTCACPRSCSTSRPGCSGRTTSPTRSSSSGRTTCGPCPRARAMRRPRRCRPRPTTSSCGCRARPSRSSCSSSRWSRSSGRT